MPQSTKRSTHYRAVDKTKTGAGDDLGALWRTVREAYPEHVREKVEALFASGVRLSLADVCVLEFAEFARISAAGKITDADRMLSSKLRHLRILSDRLGGPKTEVRTAELPEAVREILARDDEAPQADLVQ